MSRNKTTIFLTEQKNKTLLFCYSTKRSLFAFLWTHFIGTRHKLDKTVRVCLSSSYLSWSKNIRCGNIPALHIIMTCCCWCLTLTSLIAHKVMVLIRTFVLSLPVGSSAMFTLDRQIQLSWVPPPLVTPPVIRVIVPECEASNITTGSITAWAVC